MGIENTDNEITESPSTLHPFSHKTGTLVGLGFLLLLVIAMPITILSLRTQQNPESKASTTSNPLSCNNTPADVILVFDSSNSMSGAKLTAAKTAAKNFIDTLATNPQNRVGLITFAAKATVNSPLTTNYSAVKTAIDNITLSLDTCIQCGVNAANNQFTTNPSTNKKAVILLTDGIANAIEGTTGFVLKTTAEAKTITAIQNGYAANNAPYYTIGLGTNVNTSFLQQIANSTGARYNFSPSPNQLNQVYQDISQVIGKGTVSGFVFQDSNNDHLYEQAEPKLPGWKIDLKDVTNTTLLSTQTTDTAGNYTFTALCNNTYIVSQEQQTNWTQTVPQNPSHYVITITNGSVKGDQNFGNNQSSNLTPTNSPSITNTPSSNPTVTFAPTVTDTPGATKLAFTVFMNGIGSGGDNIDPTAKGNPSPHHPQRVLDITIYDANNQLITSTQGNITYASQSGNFIGTADIPTIPSGNYLIKIRSNQFLTKRYPNIITITHGIVNTLPSTTLTVGDINNDNVIDLKDYQILSGCYTGDFTAAKSCTPEQQLAADINDDGIVNAFDYNLFIRQSSAQQGD